MSGSGWGDPSRAAGRAASAPAGRGAGRRPRIAGALLILLWLCRAAGASGTGGTELAFEAANRTYEGLELQAEPVVWGPLQLLLWARDVQFSVLAHRLALSPLADGSHRAQLVVRARGQGTLRASATLLSWSTQQSDLASAPAQEREVAGRLRVAREADRYRVTPLELPARVSVQIRTGLAERLVGWCEGLPLLPVLGIECDDLRHALTTVDLPLPRPGETYDVLRSDLSDAEERALDEYLGAAERALSGGEAPAK